MKLKTAIIALILTATVVYLGGYYNGHKKADRASEASIHALDSIISHQVVTIDDQVTYIAKKEQEVLTQREAIKRGEIEREELRKLNLKQANELTRLNLRIDTLLEDVSHNGQVVTVHDTVIINKEQNCILLPFSFVKNDQWLTLNGTFDSKGKLGVSLKMNIDVDLWTGRLKGSKELTSILTTTNPYISVIGIKSQKYDLPKQKKMGIGFIGGYGISKNAGLTPFVGFGISYNLIRF
jgi:hypothetical protein